MTRDNLLTRFHIDREIRELLRAVGGVLAMQPEQQQQQSGRRQLAAKAATAASMVKAGVEDAAQVLHNYEEVCTHFERYECFHRMLVARGYMPFGLRDCAESPLMTDVRLARSIETPTAEDERLRRERGTRLQLKPSECLTTTASL